jgi:hypothetical protein
VRYPGFCGPSSQLQSAWADCERTVNWYYEPIQDPGAPFDAALYPVPGLSPFIEPAAGITDSGARGGISVNGRTFMVVGSGFYELLENGQVTRRGTVAQDGNPATVTSNGVAGGQLFITSGGNGYTYTLATNVLTKVLDDEATMGGMLSARFLAFNVKNGKVRMSGQNDGLTWDATLYFQRTLAADPWRAMLVNPPNIWLIGEYTGEVWYDSGAFPQPFAPVNGAFFPYGTPATFSAQVVGEYVTWLAKGKEGAPIVVAARGYAPAEISNFAVGTALSRYYRNGQVSDAEVLAYGDADHLFACFQFPSARATWCFDFATGSWAERGTWNSAQNRFDAWSPRVHLAAFGRHLVGLRNSGTISTLDPTVGTEADGTPIRRVRVAPPLVATPDRRVIVDRLQVYAEPGLGTRDGQGADPQLMLRVSYDGKTWGNERMTSAGRRGQYRHKVVFNRCGSSDVLWVPEISVSDPVPWRLVGADLRGSGIAVPQRVAR